MLRESPQPDLSGYRNDEMLVQERILCATCLGASCAEGSRVAHRVGSYNAST